MFAGREHELSLLQKSYESKLGQLAVVYGRRRVGKSELLNRFCQKRKNLYFEGIENSPTPVQIQTLLNAFSAQTNDPFFQKLRLKKWSEVFDLLTEHLKKQSGRTVIVFDEFQWLASQQSRLVSLLKYYWDNHWKKLNVFVVLCGSIAHFMVKKVIFSKALYGRINLELNLQPLKPNESRKMLSKRSEFETLQYLMLFGGIPKYLEEIDQNKSFSANINRLCFTKNGLLVGEVDKIFYSQFREAETYRKIVEALSAKNMTLTEISKKLKIPSGGGLKSYLDNLERASFIRTYVSFHHSGKKNQKFKLFDEYLIFNFKFIKPNLSHIKENESRPFFQNMIEKNWKAWLGIAFETFCLKNALYIAERAQFADEVISWAPYFGPKDSQFQIDLIYKRTNNVITVCEIKFNDKPVGTSVIPEVESKLKLLGRQKNETVEKMLICVNGVDRSLVDSQYFHHILSVEDLFP